MPSGGRRRRTQLADAFALSGDRERAADAGAAGYLAKPYSPAELLALVRKFLPE